MSKAATENDKSVSTEFVAATFESDLVTLEAFGEKVWKMFWLFWCRKIRLLYGKN